MKKLLISLLTLSVTTSLMADDWDIKGEARALGNGDFLYEETHYLTYSDDGDIQERRVEYTNADGDIIAIKVLTHDTDYRYVPSLDWEDREEDITITGRLSNNTYTQRIQGPSRDEEESASLTDSDNVAFDAAFDQYLLDRMDQLLDDGRIQFDFLSLSAGRTYSFRADVESSSDTEAEIEVGPRSSVIRWFVDPITLTYDLDERRLTRFVGVTNFRRDGDLLEADIRYRYPDESE